MKKVTNIKSPEKNVLFVDDAYVNGTLIHCISEGDDFDLWADCWKIEDMEDKK